MAALARTQTVGEVIAAMMLEITAAAPAQAQAPVAVAVATAVVTAPSAAKAGGAGGRGDEARRVVLRVLSEKTGYDEDMIEPDMELETARLPAATFPCDALLT